MEEAKQETQEEQKLEVDFDQKADEILDESEKVTPSVRVKVAPVPGSVMVTSLSVITTITSLSSSTW